MWSERYKQISDSDYLCGDKESDIKWIPKLSIMFCLFRKSLGNFQFQVRQSKYTFPPH